METAGLTLASFVFQHCRVVEGVFRPLLGEVVVFRPLLGVEASPPAALATLPPTGGVIGGEGGATPTRYIAGGEGGASPTGGLAGGEGDGTLMSDEEFKRRYVVTEAGKALWEKCKAGDEGDATLMSDEEFVRRYVVTEAGKALWEKCINPPSLTHLHTVVFEQPKPTATLKRLHLLEKCILFNRSTSRCSLLGIPPPCTGLPGDCKLQLCFLKCATRRYTAHTPSDDELDHLVLEF
ncbi:hypothetical protein SASPL_118649 [Salvia splendens]|uniref:Uncharacterized protein n=1 Tax=Salvia splendens TaxID=180675 RepID=A0A8X8Y2R9_SALSN|nr:hypothetical protein SASPL_118649 [Salvia splendens]